MPIFDTHAHYDSNAFQTDREAVLEALPAAGVGLVVDPGCELESSRAALALAEQYPHVYAAVGIHPSDCAGAGDAEFDAIRELCRHDKAVAVGEIGLDYYWKDNPPKEFQQSVFRRQIELALELELPVIVHDREAHGDSLAIVLEYPELRGVFHCFSGSPEMAVELLKRGWYLGFDGPITYKNAQKAPEVAAVTPLDRIVVETDSPYLTPVPFRGKRNDSRNLPYVLKKLAEWKDVSIEALTQITWENGLRLFPKIQNPEE
ncbi:MAG: TatD family hydrolase [Oscillibacter sp.]|nr:TatD family hydrolase [Oscillibacter sp.]